MKVQEARADYTVGTTGQRDWPVMTIEEIADVNPRVDKAAIPNDMPVSFVPMPAVGAGNGSIQVEETRPAGEVKKGFTAFLEGDVLFAKITPCMENGKMAVVPKLVNGYGFGSTEFHVLRPKPGIDAKYLYYYVSSQAFRDEAERYMTGAVGQKRVSTTYLKRATIPVAPVDQQKCIVAEIEKQFSRLDEAVANLKRVKANLKRYKAAVLKAAVEGRLVETEAERARREGRSFETGAQLLQRILETRRSQWKGKGKYKESAAPDTTALPELPEGWVWATVDLVCEQIVDCPHSTARFMPDGYPCIDTTWMTKEGLAVQRARYVDEVTYHERIARLAPKPGDIVFAREGTIGTAILVPERMKPCLGQRVMLLRPSIHFLGSLLRYTLHSEIVRSQYLAQALGSTVPHINVGDVKAFRIPVPPLAEQHRIVAEVDRRLSILGGTDSQADVNLQRSERLRQAILAKAFSGHLVNQSIPREAIAASVGKR
jgi:type I restriction enzyme S subunit